MLFVFDLMVSIKSVLFARAVFTSYRDINMPRMGYTTYYRGWLGGLLRWTTQNLASLSSLSGGMAASPCEGRQWSGTELLTAQWILFQVDLG